MRDGGIAVPREQVINCIREAGWKFSDQSKRVEMYKRGTQRMDVLKRDFFSETAVRVMLRTAGLTDLQVERFLHQCLKAQA